MHIREYPRWRTSSCFKTKHFVFINIILYDFIENNENRTLLSIVLPFGSITVIIFVAASFVLYRRKKIYGGFYLFSYPPLPDYMATLDENVNIQDQIQKLPFIPEWEFPRERITLGK